MSTIDSVDSMALKDMLVAYANGEEVGRRVPPVPGLEMSATMPTKR